MKKKINIISDNNIKSKKIKLLLIKKLKKVKYLRPNLRIIIGGDGFMLKTLKKNRNFKNIFYGINSGNYGFLMNKFSKEKIIKNLNKSKVTTISPLEMKVINNNNSVKNYLAINEVSIQGDGVECLGINLISDILEIRNTKHIGNLNIISRIDISK